MPRGRTGGNTESRLWDTIPTDTEVCYDVMNNYIYLCV